MKKDAIKRSIVSSLIALLSVEEIEEFSSEDGVDPSVEVSELLMELSELSALLAELSAPLVALLAELAALSELELRLRLCVG